MRPFWDAVAAMRLPVYFTLIGGRGSALYERSWQETYLDEQRVLMRWMERYPEQTVVITHGLPWRSFLDGDRIRFPEEIWRVFDSPRCHLQLLIPIQMGGMWEYPWTEAEPTRTGVRRASRRRPPDMGHRHSDGEPVLHLQTDQGPVPDALRLPHRGRAPGHPGRHGRPRHGPGRPVALSCRSGEGPAPYLMRGRDLGSAVQGQEILACGFLADSSWITVLAVRLFRPGSRQGVRAMSPRERLVGLSIDDVDGVPKPRPPP